MKKSVTSKEEILQACREIVATDGLESLNMRLVAAKCNIAPGTLYNYYSDKNELLLGTIESVWRDIFHHNDSFQCGNSFTEYVRALFTCMIDGAEEYPDFFSTHSVIIASAKRGEARSVMEHYFLHMKEEMEDMLEKDPCIKDGAFNENLKKSSFIDFVLDHLILLIVKGQTSCEYLLEIIRRIIY